MIASLTFTNDPEHDQQVKRERVQQLYAAWQTLHAHPPVPTLYQPSPDQQAQAGAQWMDACFRALGRYLDARAEYRAQYGRSPEEAS